jgi:heme exporter protein A
MEVGFRAPLHDHRHGRHPPAIGPILTTRTSPIVLSTAASAPETGSDAAQLPTLSLVGLSCRRGDRLLFKGVDLEVPPGRAVWLRGRNGRGKTSLLRLACGLAVPEAGSVLWGGVAVRRAAGYADRRLYIGHANALKEDLTVRESLRFLAHLHGRAHDDASIDAALVRVGMASRRDAAVRTLSQGQRRRAALARLALERAAGLWILDEPYDALDVDGIACVDGLLHEQLARGGSVLLTSHLPPGPGAPPMSEFDLDRFA